MEDPNLSHRARKFPPFVQHSGLPNLPPNGISSPEDLIKIKVPVVAPGVIESGGPQLSMLILGLLSGGTCTEFRCPDLPSIPGYKHYIFLPPTFKIDAEGKNALGCARRQPTQ
jgi:hypothetical protein